MGSGALQCVRKLSLPLAALVAFSAQAAPRTYFVNFSGAGDLPGLGMFTYDDTAATFSNFVVAWDGNLFNMTAAANSPLVGGACAGASASAATGLALMTHNMCSGLFYRWGASQDAVSSSFLFYSETLALPAQTGASILTRGPGGNSPIPNFAAGDWTVQEGHQGHPGELTYLVNFTGGQTLPALGIFSYDPNTTSFSNFAVLWDGLLFDLTDAANAPLVGGACAGTSASGATGLALMSHDMCSGLFYRWGASQDAVSSSFLFYSETLALPARTGASILTRGPGGNSPIPNFAAGDWTLFEVSAAAVPEPSSAAMVMLGLMGVGWAGRRRARHTAQPGREHAA